MSHISEKKQGVLGRLALLATTLIWGTSFVILKNVLDSIDTLYVLAFRFSGAAVLLFLLSIPQLKKLDRSYLKGGAAMGLFLFIAYVLQTYGLLYTTPGINAFLTASYCILVPFLYWLIRRRKPDKYNITAAVVCITGMAFIFLRDDLKGGLGETLTVCSSLFFSLHIIATGRFADGRSPVLLSMLQFVVAAVLAWIFALCTGPLPTSISSGAIGSIAYLCVMCTAVCFLLQTIGQKYTPPTSSSVILTLESVFGTAFSVMLGQEDLSLRLVLGFVLIFCAVLISETKLSFLKRKKQKTD